jgi:hypothetical protein
VGVLLVGQVSPAYLNFKYEGRVPWPNSHALLQDIDLLPSGAPWSSEKIILEGRYKYVLCVFWRDPVEVVRELISNRQLKNNIKYTPQRHFTSTECLVRIFSEMWTGDWWWETQVSSYQDEGKELTYVKHS